MGKLVSDMKPYILHLPYDLQIFIFAALYMQF